MNAENAQIRSYALTMPAVCIITAFFAVPLVWVLIQSFAASSNPAAGLDSFTFDNYKRFLTDDYYVNDLLWRTVKLSLIATAISLVLGYIGALAITRASAEVQPWLIFLNMCPLWVNLVVRTLSLMVVFGRDGPLNQALLHLGMIQRPLQLLYNEAAVVLGMVQVSMPFVILALYGVLRSIPRELEHAAMSVGAGPLSAFRRVTLPLSVPGVLAGTILAFGINMESFVVPILLGGGRVKFMSVAAYEMATVSDNLPFAATIGIVLLVVTVLMLGLYQWLVNTVNRPRLAPVVS